MASEFLCGDRDQLFLLPVSMRDWLPVGHLVWFVLEVVERLDTGVLRSGRGLGGVGRRGYDPDLLLGVLIYAYCMGERSSRQIERLCEVDVAFRVLAGGLVPDHSTIARFRQDHGDVAVGLFADVLMLCREAGLARVGVVAVDGTKVGADASLKANRSRVQVETEIRAMFDEAGVVDAGEDRLFGAGRGDELPVELTDPRYRAARLDSALKVLERERLEREAAAEVARKERAVKEAERGGARFAGRPPKGTAVDRAREALLFEQGRVAERFAERARQDAEAVAAGRPVNSHRLVIEHRDVKRARKRLANALAKEPESERATQPEPADRINITDRDSRVMKDPKGWVQGYNAQAAVNEEGIVVGAVVTQDGNDFEQCVPMMAEIQSSLDRAGITEKVGVLLFDAGYLSDANMTAPGPDRLIATSKAWKLRKTDPTNGPPPDGSTALERMNHRLRTPEGAALYALRQHTVEPVFGDIKHLRGFRRFSRRGLRAVTAEWLLQMSVHNVLKLFRHSQTATT